MSIFLCPVLKLQDMSEQNELNCDRDSKKTALAKRRGKN